MSQSTQSDFDTGLDPAWRVALDNQPNSIMLGSPVSGIRTSWGNIAAVPDVFIRDEAQQLPFRLVSRSWLWRTTPSSLRA